MSGGIEHNKNRQLLQSCCRPGLIIHSHSPQHAARAPRANTAVSLPSWQSQLTTLILLAHLEASGISGVSQYLPLGRSWRCLAVGHGDTGEGGGRCRSLPYKTSGSILRYEGRGGDTLTVPCTCFSHWDSSNFPKYTPVPIGWKWPKHQLPVRGRIGGQQYTQ